MQYAEAMGFRMIGLLIGALILLGENSVQAQLTAEVSAVDQALPGESGGAVPKPNELAARQWEETREEILMGIDLSPEQAAQILTVGERAQRKTR